MPNKDKDILIRQIIETDNVIGTMYYQFLERAIEMKDNSRFKLVDFTSILLQINLGNEKISKNNIYNLLDPTLFRITKLIIDNNDFELFKHLINHFIIFQVLESPIEIRDRIEEKLYKLSDLLYLNKFIETYEELETEMESFRFLVQYKLFRNFDLWEEISNKLDGYQKLIKTKVSDFEEENKLHKVETDSFNKDYEEFKNNLEKIKEGSVQIIQGNLESAHFGIKFDLYEFWINSLAYKTFFIIGAYLVFCNRTKKVNGTKYLKELWFHTKPTPYNETILITSTLISFDPFWLIFLYLYGGEGDPNWISWPYEFDDFHEAKQYVTQYLLLCLTKTKNFDIYSSSLYNLITIKHRTSELEEIYDLVFGFYSARKDLIYNIEILIQESDEWDSILSYKEIKDGKEIIVDAKKALNQTKENINKIMEELEKLQVEIAQLLPLNEEKIEKAITIMDEYHEKNSKLLNNFESRDYIKEKDLNKEFIEITGIRGQVNRECLVKTGKILYVDCRVIWQNAARTIVNEELKILNNLILENKEITVTFLDDLEPEIIYKKIISTTESLKEYDPNLLFIPKNIFYKFRKSGINPNSSLYNKITRKELEINDNIKLKVIISSFTNNFIIMNNKSISCVYKTDLKSKKKIILDVTELKENIAKTDIFVRSMVNFEITNVKAIKIVHIPQNDD